jgi:hypothetical protein
VGVEEAVARVAGRLRLAHQVVEALGVGAEHARQLGPAPLLVVAELEPAVLLEQLQGHQVRRAADG